MEWWNFAASQSDVRREDYPSERRYNLAKQNSCEFPRFCISLFRPRPDALAALLSATDQYQGQVVWSLHDNGIGAFPSRPGFINRTENIESLKAVTNPPIADPELASGCSRPQRKNSNRLRLAMADARWSGAIKGVI
jgi:hypothetical protein